MAKVSTMDMTSGPLFKKIVLFALPLMASNVLMLLFNAADIVVLGQFAGENSLAAVGSIATIVALFTLFLVGFGVGVNVLIARYTGAGGQEEAIQKTLHTAVLMGAISGVVLMALGLLLAEPMAALIKVPDEILGEALLYMRIAVIGCPFISVYNFMANAMRAVGDTKRPLIFLAISGVINVCLNVYFVTVLHMGTAGVAIATVTAQFLNMVMAVITLSREKSALHFSFKKLAIDKTCLKILIRYGLPSGIQSTMFSLSNIAVQGAINSYGPIVVAASAAGANIEGFAYITLNAFSLTTLTFVSQNFGAKNIDRIKKTLRITLSIILVLGLLEGFGLAFFGKYLVGIYNSNPAVLAEGAIRLMVMGFPYALFGLSDSIVASIRGIGYPTVPVVIQMFCVVAFRIIYTTFILDTSTMPVMLVYLSYPISWGMLFVCVFAFWLYASRKKLPQKLGLVAAQTAEE